MKRLPFIGLMCAVMLLAACKQKEEPKPDPQPDPQPEVESIASDKSAPTWAAPSEYDMTASMTAIIRVDLSMTYSAEQIQAGNYQLSENDVLAAFSGETCLGVAEQIDGLFYLYITSPSDDSQVKFRYYSATLKNNFVSRESVPFSNDSSLGTVSSPYTPEFEVEKAN